ncbi:MAG: hypothetical protein JRJ51_08240 [Deltaproteobacteria bacterium]|jgi:uncharacterized integral membrane protein|nr:hypothetical protein [Deltaproteobacteria bacterium]
MYKTLTTIVLTGVAVLFAIQNFDHVPVYIFWGKVLQIRLIFVVAIAGTAGYIIKHFVGIRREERLKRQFRMFRQKGYKTKVRRKREGFDEGDF